VEKNLINGGASVSKEKKCTICSGTGKRIIVTRIGLVTVPITQNCPSCGGNGKVLEG
jgi:DnaJ-class molecular chaperone